MARPRGVEPLTFWSVVKRSIQLSYGRYLCFSWWCFLDIHYGAAERTRTSTGLYLPAPQAGASTIPPRPLSSFSWHITMKLMERVKRIELSQSAWKAEVLPLNYTRILNGREDRIRTCDPLVPNQVLYQAEPLPVLNGGPDGNRTRDLLRDRQAC